MEASVYIIKPEAIPHTTEIHELIEASGLRIAAMKVTTLDEQAVSAIYPELGGDLRGATLHYLGLGLCEIGVVEGENAIGRLCALAGASVDPNACGPTTIRGRFGVRAPARFGDADYYLNGFHRSRDAAEASRDLALFGTLAASQNTSLT